METITRIRRTNEKYLNLWVSVLWELDGFNEYSECFEWEGKDENGNPWFGESNTESGKINPMRL